MLDLLITGGSLVDGTGAPAFDGDVGISGDRIVRVGKIAAPAHQTIDASGLTVTPGFVDIHTHYDGQATWDSQLAPSSLHGVTSLAFGNCGVGFAPARPDRHEWLINLLEGVEDIPGTALSEGMSWGWESFPQYLDILGRREFAVDIGAHMPHAALRSYVMGDRGGDMEAQPSVAEMAEMARLTVAAIAAGALGFSTSRTIVHRTRDGHTIGTARVKDNELSAIAQAIGELGKGVIQLISDAYLLADEAFAAHELDLVEHLAQISRRPISMTVQQIPDLPERWRWMIGRIDGMRERGLDVRAQVACRAIGGILGLRTSVNPFLYTPYWQKLEPLSLPERVNAMRQPDVRTRLLHEIGLPNSNPLAAFITRGFHRMFRMDDPVDYEPPPEKSIAAEASRAGRDVIEHVYDVLLEEDGNRLIYMPSVNFAAGNLDDVHAMMASDAALYGLSDGGAHCGMICDASFPTTAMTLWPRGNRAGLSFPLERLVHGYTQRNARHVGWHDRGVLAEGYLADLNVIDLGALALPPPEPVYDLPAGGMRLMQHARGYRWTVKSGQVTRRDGQFTGALPGRLVRGATTRGRRDVPQAGV